MRLEHVHYERHNGHRLYNGHVYRLYKGHGFWDLGLGRHRWRLHYGVCVCPECRQVVDNPACIECWCDGNIRTASQFRIFRWLCDEHAANYPSAEL